MAISSASLAQLLGLDSATLLVPAERELQIRRSLEFNLRAVVCQKLLPSIKKGVAMVPATEILITSPMVRKLIHDGEDNRLSDAIRQDTESGMMDFNQSLAALVKADLVDRKVALSHSDSPEALKRELSGITTRASILR